MHGDAPAEVTSVMQPPSCMVAPAPMDATMKAT